MQMLRQLCKVVSFASFASLKICGAMLLLTAIANSAHAAPVAPEMDPGSITSAVTLLVGGLLMLRSRRGNTN
jgi:hypothetical protein